MPKALVRAADRTSTPEESFSHPLNPSSEIHGRPLSDLTGLTRVGVWIVRVAPGKESFAKHVHYVEEEWMYVLEGRGLVELDDQTYEIGVGDFVGFAAGGPAHHVRNPWGEDLIYLSGGERGDHEVADFPALGKRMVRKGQKIVIYPLEAGADFPGFPRL